MRAWLRKSFVAGLALALLGVFATPADAAIAIAQTIKKQISSASSGTTASVTTTNGSTFVVFTADPNTALTISDSKTNVWTQAGADFLVTGNVTGQVWYVCNGTGGASHTFTVTAGAGTMDSAFFVYELTGTAASCYDSASANQVEETDGSTPFTVTSGTLAQANNVAISYIFSTASPTTWTIGGGWTKNQEETNDSVYWTSAVASITTAATTALTPSWTDSGSAGNLGVMIRVFKEAAGGGGNNLLMKRRRH